MNRHEVSPRQPALDELRAIDREPDWRAMEGRLVGTLAQPAADVTAVAASSRWSRSWWPWTAAAAVLVAAAVTYLPPSRYGTTLTKGEDVRLAAPKPTPPPATGEPPRVPSPPATPAPRKPSRRTQATSARTTPPAVPSPTAPAVSEFVALPGAFALPDLESGRIVRFEVPVTALPAYGIALGADAAPSPVQADFLIGQDGVARAIRLASSSQR